jgi:DNA helicase II / ATP-dependent DNA helicase PcrA
MMLNRSLTPEQQAVVNHPRGQHARVLAVAGSGKTTTMAQRVRHLVVTQHVNPRSIVILMFNREARTQFEQKLSEVGIPRNQHPPVHTFHSFSYQLLSDSNQKGMSPKLSDNWFGDREELVRIHIHRAIRTLIGQKQPPMVDNLDPEEAMTAISLWKGSLLPPERAGYRGSESYPLVYREFERFRLEKGALTYDDFVPLAVGLLENDPSTQQKWLGRTEFLIIDEYQDVNYGQQRLIELLAGKQADVMVVGDDDQTIYEWRGARPSYILRQFVATFSNKPHTNYTLSRSFRFGPVIAQCAENVIRFNLARIPKPLIAHKMSQPVGIHLIVGNPIDWSSTSKEMTNQVLALLRSGNRPDTIRILARMYSQLSGMEAEFLTRKIPYRLEGNEPFFKRREVKALVDSLELGEHLDDPLTQERIQQLVSTANLPNRYLRRELLEQVFRDMYLRGATARQALHALLNIHEGLNSNQLRKAEEWLLSMDRLHDRLHREPDLSAHLLLEWWIKLTNYLSYFDDYYGKGEASADRKQTVQSLIDYAQRLTVPASAFVHHIKTLDPSRGMPEDQLVVMTTIFRTKGLEFDYVFIPDCIEGNMPCLYGENNQIYDKAGLVQETEASDTLENERRLFYVGLTRARKAVYIGTITLPEGNQTQRTTSSRPSRFLYEMELEPTRDIMQALQELATAPGEEAKQVLLNRLEKYGGIKRVTRNVIDAYLVTLDDPQFCEAAKAAVNSAPTTPFAYPIAYDTNAVPSKTEEKAWWEEDL